MNTTPQFLREADNDGKMPGTSPVPKYIQLKDVMDKWAAEEHSLSTSLENPFLTKTVRTSYQIQVRIIQLLLADLRSLPVQSMGGESTLVDLQDQYIKFLSDEYNYAFSNASAHGYKTTEDAVLEGKSLREQIEEARQSLSSPIQPQPQLTIDKIKNISWIAWQAAANAYRMYPDNKHTFSDYWDTEKDQFAQLPATDPKKCNCRSNNESCAYFNDDRHFCYLNEHNEPINYIDSLPAAPSVDAKEREDEWVSVEDGLPKEGKRVIVYYLNDYGKLWRDICTYTYGGVIEFDDEMMDFPECFNEEKQVSFLPEGFWFNSDVDENSFKRSNVTHWQPLPTPPKN